MAYQSEIELRVKVNDVEIERLEKRIARLNTKPGLVAGKASSVLSKQLRLRKGENQLIKNNLDLQNKVQQAAVRELNTRTQFVRLFKDAANIRASYAKDADRAAKSAERAALAAEKEAAAVKKTAVAKAAANKRDRQKRADTLALGVGFPLLFGGGIGSVAGGGLGGLLGTLGGGSGFGAQILGSAIGTAVDAFATQAAEVGQALNSTGGAFDLLTEKSLFSSKETELLANQLAELGEVEKLATLVTEELVGIIGNKGVESLQTLGDTTDETTRLWGALTLQLQKLVAGPLNAFLSLINRALGAQVQLGQFKSLIEDNPAAQARYKELIGARRGRDAAKNGMSQAEARAQVLKEFPPVVTAQIPVTAEDRKRFTPPKAGKKGRALPQSRELQLRQEILKTELSLADIETKRRALQASDLGVILLQDQALYDRLTTEIQILELARQQALVSSKVPKDAVFINNLYDQRLEKLKRENDLQREENLLRGEQIKLQQTLTAIRNKQETEGVVRDLDRKIKDANSRDSVDSSASEMLALRIKQLRRREDLIGRITNKIEEQDAIIASGDVKKIPAAEKELEALKDRKAAIEALLPVLNQAEQAELRQKQLMEKYGFIANEAATAMSSAVQSVITGTGSVQEAFSNMFANIGKAFIDMATQMIAKALIMKAIGILTSAFGGGGGIGFNPSAPSITGNSIGDFGGGTAFAGAFAEGGYVTGPTNALIGEGGEPEYVIPESKMRESMGRYSRGSRGSSVIPAEGGGSAGAEGGVAVAAPIDVRYTVERINSVDYVTADQFQTGMKRAALEGAQRGQQLTLSRLQQSPATRRRIGM